MQCKATNRAGNRCGRGAIEGGTVCHMHGGKSPQAIRAAAERIAALVDPALRRIESTIANDKRPDLALIASRDILDRAGHKAAEKMEHNVVMQGISERLNAARQRRLTE